MRNPGEKPSAARRKQTPGGGAAGRARQFELARGVRKSDDKKEVAPDDRPADECATGDEDSKTAGGGAKE